MKLNRNLSLTVFSNSSNFVIRLFVLLLSLCCINAFASDEVSNEDLTAAHKYQVGDVRSSMLGVGIARVVNDDYYAGALYIDESLRLAEIQQLLEMNVARSMHYRFLADRKVSARGFKRKIAEAIRVNNTSKAIKEQKGILTEFLGVFKGSFEQGDEVCFDYHPQTGIATYIKGQKVSQIKNSDKLFTLILNTWLGNTPPSEKFKQDVLGQNESAEAVALLKRFVAKK
jgi:hypothetical protein